MYDIYFSNTLDWSHDREKVMTVTKLSMNPLTNNHPT